MDKSDVIDETTAAIAMLSFMAEAVTALPAPMNAATKSARAE